MGADSTVVFYGLRFSVDDSEVEQLGDSTDARVVRARENGLAHWWGEFASDEDDVQNLLFVGSLVGHIGHEGVYEVSLRDDEIDALVVGTRNKLRQAGFSGEPRLYLQFEPDY
jgi:hypothetical protein